MIADISITEKSFGPKILMTGLKFSVDDGGVTPNMKIRRAAVTQRFADVVAGLYEDEIGE